MTLRINSRPWPGLRGFTLVEVLIGTLCFAVILAAFILGLSFIISSAIRG